MGKATQIYRNGTILTMDSRGSVVSALAVEGNVVLAVGTDDDVMAHAGPDTVVTDLRGRTMLPGFVDGHSHFVWAGLMFATQLDLFLPAGRQGEGHCRNPRSAQGKGRLHA